MPWGISQSSINWCLVQVPRKSHQSRTTSPIWLGIWLKWTHQHGKHSSHHDKSHYRKSISKNQWMREKRLEKLGKRNTRVERKNTLWGERSQIRISHRGGRYIVMFLGNVGIWERKRDKEKLSIVSYKNYITILGPPVVGYSWSIIQVIWLSLNPLFHRTKLPQ